MNKISELISAENSYAAEGKSEKVKDARFSSLKGTRVKPSNAMIGLPGKSVSIGIGSIYDKDPEEEVEEVEEEDPRYSGTSSLNSSLNEHLSDEDE